MWSSRTPQRAFQKTLNTEFRAPEDLEELSSSLQGPKPELPNISRSCQAASKERISSEQTKKKVSKTKESNQAKKRATKQPSKRAHEQTSKRANEHTINRTNKQANKQEVGGVPRRACNYVTLKQCTHQPRVAAQINH